MLVGESLIVIVEIQPAQRTFCALIEQYKNKDLDVAFKFFRASSGLGVRTTSLDAHILGTKLATLGRWAGIYYCLLSHDYLLFLRRFGIRKNSKEG